MLSSNEYKANIDLQLIELIGICPWTIDGKTIYIYYDYVWIHIYSQQFIVTII